MTATRPGIARVRPCVEADVPHIAALYRRVWGAGDGSSARVGEGYFAEVLFRNPCHDDALGSLVCEDDEGRIVGCLGVMPRWMSTRGRRVRVAVSHNLMVDPDSRSTLAAVSLLKRYFSGPQDLSIAQGNDVSRRIWEGLGGTTALLYSVRWTRPLRPGRYLLYLLKTRGLRARLAGALRPVCGLVDAVATRMRSSPLRQPTPRVSGTELSAETVLAFLPAVTGDWLLRPEYDSRSLRWFFRMLDRKEGLGALRAVVVSQGQHDILGWYLYYANPGGIGEVAQIAARQTSVDQVLDHLFYDAWRQGVVALSGQLEPRFIEALSDRYCAFRHGGSWMLVHARDPELLHTIHYGDAFLTRLDGEWWINP